MDAVAGTLSWLMQCSMMLVEPSLLQLSSCTLLLPLFLLLPDLLLPLLVLPLLLSLQDPLEVYHYVLNTREVQPLPSLQPGRTV